MKKITLLIAVMLLSLFSASFANTKKDVPPVHIYFNGAPIEWTDALPFIDENGRSMIPLRAVSENLGAEVEWDSKTSTAHVKLADKEVSLQIGKNYGMVNGVKQEFDTVTIISGGRTYVPLRFVSEALGYEVRYRFGRDERANNQNAHIIDIGNQSTLVLTPRAELGWENAYITLEEKNIFYSKFKTIPAMQNSAIGGQVNAFSTSIEMSRVPSSEYILFDPVIKITLRPLNQSGEKEHIQISIGRLPTGWEEFLILSLEFMAGQDGVVIANDMIKTFKSVYDADANIYRTSTLPNNLTVTSGRYTYNYSTGKITW